MPKPIHDGFASKHQFEQTNYMKMYQNEGRGTSHTVWTNVASCLMWTAIVWAIGSGVAMLLEIPRVVRQNDMMGMLVAIGFVGLSCVPLFLGMSAGDQAHKASMRYQKAKENAKAEENRKKFRLFAALVELASLNGRDTVRVSFEGGAITHNVGYSTVPNQTNGKTAIIPTGGISIEINKLNIETVPVKVLVAVESALEQAKAETKAQARNDREALKHL